MTLIPWHFDTTLFAITCFGVAFFSSAAGLFYNEYRENWLQHIGMICVAIASAMKMLQLFERRYTSPETALLAFGVALFALGVAWKVWQNQRNRYRPYTGPERRRDAASGGSSSAGLTSH
jgi:hypothetical protein